MNRRTIILGSAALLVPVIGRWVSSHSASPVDVADGTVATGQLTSHTATYTTNFPLIENPISEGDRWINGGIFGKTDVQTAQGKAYGRWCRSMGRSTLIRARA